MTLTDITDAMELCSRLTQMAKGTETCNYHTVNIKIILGYYRKFGSYKRVNNIKKNINLHPAYIQAGSF